MDKLERTETVVDYSTFSSDSFVFWTCVAEFAVSRINLNNVQQRKRVKRSNNYEKIVR